MAKKESDLVALQRPEKPQRKRRWWLLIPVVLIVIAAGFAIYLLQYRIADALQGAPTLPPTPPSVGTPGVIYYTDFDTPAVASDWDIFKDGFISSQIKDGQLIIDINALVDTPAWSGLHYTFDDFVLDVDAAKLAGPDDNAIMVVFRLVDPDNHNRFYISSDGYYSLTRVRGGVATVVSEFARSPAIQIGSATNHIRITAQGSSFRFEVNGTPLMLCTTSDPNVGPLWNNPDQPTECLGGTIADSWQNDDLSKGRIGLGAQGYVGLDSQGALATIGFDNLVVKAP